MAKRFSFFWLTWRSVEHLVLVVSPQSEDTPCWYKAEYLVLYSWSQWVILQAGEETDFLEQWWALMSGQWHLNRVTTVNVLPPFPPFVFNQKGQTRWITQVAIVFTNRAIHCPSFSTLSPAVPLHSPRQQCSHHPRRKGGVDRWLMVPIIGEGGGAGAPLMNLPRD